MVIENLYAAELDLLKWLGREDFSQYGECHGVALDALVARGFAQIHRGRERQGGFIVKGDGLEYRAVSLTEIGREYLRGQSAPEAMSTEGIRTEPISSSYPLLAIARRHGVPYAATLALAEAWILLARRSGGWRDGEVLDGLFDALNPIAKRYGLSSALLGDVRVHCVEPLLRRQGSAS